MSTTFPPLTYFRIPLSPAPRNVRVRLLGVFYRFVTRYRNAPEGGWTLDILDDNEQPLVRGLALVIGNDLLEQLQELRIGGGLWLVSALPDEAAPGYRNLGREALLYFRPYLP